MPARIDSERYANDHADGRCDADADRDSNAHTDADADRDPDSHAGQLFRRGHLLQEEL